MKYDEYFNSVREINVMIQYFTTTIYLIYNI